MNRYALSANGANSANCANDVLILVILFLLLKTQSYIPLVTLSVKDDQKVSKLLSKIFERLVYWNKYKTKIRIKIQQMCITIFLNQTL